MSLDIQQLRRIVYDGIGIDWNIGEAEPEDLPFEKVDEDLNRSWWEIMAKYHFRDKEIYATFNTIAGERNYGVPAGTEAIRNLAIVEPETNTHTPLGQITAEVYEKRYIDSEENWGFSTHYVREGCIIRLWRTPDDIYTIHMRRWTTLLDISTSNNLVIPQEWHELIGYGGLWRRFIALKDYNAAKTIQNTQKELFHSYEETQTKEKDANTSLSGLEVAWSEYGEYSGADGGRV